MKNLGRVLFMCKGGNSFDMNRGYKHTKVSHLKISNKGKVIFEADVPTWAKVIRTTIDVLKASYKDDVSKGTFEETFNKALNEYLDTNKFAPNANFSRTIFTDDSWMTSSLYKESKNHKLLLFRDTNTWEDKYICAVYADEVVWVLQALLNSINDEYTIEVNYTLRENLSVSEDIKAGVAEQDKEFDKEAFTKDMLSLQFEVSHIHSQVMSLYSRIAKISEKYGYNPQDYLDKMMGMDKYKSKPLDSTDMPF